VFDWSHVRRPAAPPDAGDWMTPVRNQERCGSCWAFAALAVVEAQYNIQNGDPDLDLDLSEQWLIDCDAHSVGCAGGGTEQALEGYLQDEGVPVESCDPFLGGDDVCLPDCRDGSTPALFRVAGISQVVTVPGGARDATQAWMRYQLVHHGPIARAIVSMYGYDPVTHRCSPASGDHYVAVVGYDHGQQLWIAKNSWGSSWNGDGYFEIAYGECAVDVAATIVDAVVAP
jgi:C1A family cysteine protease